MGPIILCHAFEDKKVVSHVYDALQAAGFEAWIDAESAFGEQESEPDMAKWLGQADCMLVFLSKNSVRKLGSTHHEFGQLIHTWKAMPEDAVYTIPVRINDCQIPELLSSLDHVDLFGDQGLETIIRCLHEGNTTRQAPRHHVGTPAGGRLDAHEATAGAFHLAVDGRGQIMDVPDALSEPPLSRDLATEATKHETPVKRRRKKSKS
jgi:hypothetical protein